LPPVLEELMSEFSQNSLKNSSREILAIFLASLRITLGFTTCKQSSQSQIIFNGLPFS